MDKLTQDAELNLFFSAPITEALGSHATPAITVKVEYAITELRTGPTE